MVVHPSASRPLLRASFPVLVCALSLAACGGGGDSGTSSAQSNGIVVPTDNRTDTVPADSDVSVANAQSLNAPLGRAVIDISGMQSSAGSSSTETGSALRGSGPSRQFALQTGARLAARERAAAIQNQTVSCGVSGSMTLTWTDANDNRKLDAGDTLGTEYSSCVHGAGLPAVNGGLALVLNQVELASDLSVTAIDANGTLTDYSAGSAAVLNGPIRLWFKQDTATTSLQRIVMNSVTAVLGGSTVIYSVNIDDSATSSDDTFRINGSIQIGDHTYRLAQTAAQAFVLPVGSELPTRGTLALSDAAGDTLTVTAGAQANFAFYPAGATAPTATWSNEDWDSLRSGQ